MKDIMTKKPFSRTSRWRTQRQSSCSIRSKGRARARGRTTLCTVTIPCCQGTAIAWTRIFRQHTTTHSTRMWASAQRDGRPAEYRWRPLFNAAKFGWCPLLEWRAVTLPRRETHWNLHGCLKHANRSQPLVDWSSPYYQDMWRRYCCLTSFFSDCR